MNLSSIIRPEDVILDLTVSTKSALIGKLSAHAAARLGLEASAIQAALNGREELGSTGIGGGVAIPHASIEHLRAPFAALMMLKKAVEFDSVDEVPVDIVFLLLTPPENTGDSLKVLSAVARKARTEQILKNLRNTHSPAEAYAVLVCDD